MIQKGLAGALRFIERNCPLPIRLAGLFGGKIGLLEPSVTLQPSITHEALLETPNTHLRNVSYRNKTYGTQQKVQGRAAHRI